MKTFKIFIFISLSAFAVDAQPETIEKTLPPFSRIVVSPKINLIIQKGDHESVRIEYARIVPGKIHADVSGKTLRLYLQGAKMIDKREKVWVDGRKAKLSVYRNVNITMYVTCKSLEKLSVRGEEEVSVAGDLSADKFKLKAYGESEIELASLTASNLKMALYGSNRVRIKSGKIERQKMKLFGENIVDTRGIESERVSSTIYGEGQVRASASNYFHLNALGEPRIQVYGHGAVIKGIVLGEPSIQTEF